MRKRKENRTVLRSLPAAAGAGEETQVRTQGEGEEVAGEFLWGHVKVEILMRNPAGDSL